MISVVVCTYNRAATLEKMLASFLAQPCRPQVEHELIVVDNNSTDGTRTIVERFGADARIRYVFEAKQGLCQARNRGLAEAKGDVVAYLDDDVLVDPNWLQHLRDCFDAEHADVVGGRSYLILDGEPPEWLGPYFRSLLSEVDHGMERKRIMDGSGLFGLNLAFRKTVLQETGGFREDLGRRGSVMLGGEDTAKVREIARRGGRVIYDPKAVVGHLIARERLRWEYFKRVTLSMGRSFAYMEPEGRAARLARLFKGVALMSIDGIRAVWPVSRSAYERRCLRGRLRSRIGYVIGQWEKLFAG